MSVETPEGLQGNTGIQVNYEGIGRIKGDSSEAERMATSSAVKTVVVWRRDQKTSNI